MRAALRAAASGAGRAARAVAGRTGERATGRAAGRARRWAGGGSDRRADQPPRTRVHTGPAVPGWVLRIAVAAPVLLAGVAVSAQGGQWVLIAAAALGLALRPQGALTALVIAALGATLVLVDITGWWRLPVLVLASHGLLWLAALAEPAAWGSRVELAVLRNALPGFLVIQAVGQGAAMLAQVLTGTAPWLVVVALVALGAVAALLTTQIARRPGARAGTPDGAQRRS